MTMTSTADRMRQVQAVRNALPFHQKARDWMRDRPEGGITIMFSVALLCCIVGGLAMPDSFRFLAQANIQVTLKSVAPLGLIALGVGVLMIAGEFDLSIGSTYSFSAVIAASFTLNYFAELGAAAPFLAVICALAIGTAIGLLNAYITMTFNIPSFITTLGAMLFWQGAVLLYNGASPLIRGHEPRRQGIRGAQGGHQHRGGDRPRHPDVTAGAGAI